MRYLVQTPDITVQTKSKSRLFLLASVSGTAEGFLEISFLAERTTSSLDGCQISLNSVKLVLNIQLQYLMHPTLKPENFHKKYRAV